jgi:aminoglycoside phosphotransferase (APT) family kinase protein
MINDHRLVEVEGREPLVLRRYGWPFAEDAPERAEREARVLELAAGSGIPAPRVIAATDEAILVTHESGRLLAHLARDPTADAGDAWREVGRVVRRLHGLLVPPELADVLRGGPRRDPTDWATHVIAGVAEDLAVLTRHRRDLAVDDDRVRDLFDRARPLLDERPEALLHGDLHPWNVLLEHDRDRWACSALLDWEFAELGDPLADLVRFDLLRDEDIGPTPRAFHDGYGPISRDPVRELYEIAFHVWMAGDVINWPVRRPSHDAAERYVRTQLEADLSRLEAELSDGPTAGRRDERPQ